MKTIIIYLSHLVVVYYAADVIIHKIKRKLSYRVYQPKYSKPKMLFHFVVFTLAIISLMYYYQEAIFQLIHQIK